MKPVHHLVLGCVSFIRFLATILVLFATSNNVSAQILATGQISNTSLGGGLFDYTITVKNTGSTNIETFWFAWIPGAGFMSASPSNVTSPTNWSDILTNSNEAIQWTTTTNPLTPGSSLDFSFESSETPSQMAGFAAPPFASTPVTTSFVYIGAPLADPGDQFVVESAPEPSALGLLALGALAFISLRRVRFRVA